MIWNLRLTEFRKSLITLDIVLSLKIDIFEKIKDSFICQRLKSLCSFKHVAEAPPPGALGNEPIDMHFDLEQEDGLFNNYTPILKPF